MLCVLRCIFFCCALLGLLFFFFFFFNDPATTEIYTLSLHDALPILSDSDARALRTRGGAGTHLHGDIRSAGDRHRGDERSEEHTSELQSRVDLVCRLLLEKKKKKKKNITLIKLQNIDKHS